MLLQVSATVATMQSATPKEGLNFWITDPHVMGWVQWISLAITIVGFAVAWWRTYKAQSAAEAARDASRSAAGQLARRYRFLFLSDAMRLLEELRRAIEEERDSLQSRRLLKALQEKLSHIEEAVPGEIDLVSTFDAVSTLLEALRQNDALTSPTGRAVVSLQLDRLSGVLARHAVVFTTSLK
jgi:hypothetical protein